MNCGEKQQISIILQDWKVSDEGKMSRSKVCQEAGKGASKM